jgi:dihydropyrimidine dehydrogenase (NAD+) subunit PreA
MTDIHVDFCGLNFENPFILAASPSTDNREMISRGFDAGWAGAVLKTTTLETEEVSIAYPIMSSLNPGIHMIGLNNIDLVSERYIDEIAEDILWLKQRFPEKRVIASLMGHTQEDWKELVSIAEQAGSDLIEASISCPQGAALENEENQGSMVSQDSRLTEIVSKWAVESTQKAPVYIKLSPSVTDIASIARASQRGGAAAVCAIDTLEGIAGIDLKRLVPFPNVQGFSTRGGYSGRAIKPVALRCLVDIVNAINIPISGVGGIYTWQDAVEFMLLGARTVQVCTAVMHKGFSIIDDLKNGLSHWMDTQNFTSVDEFVGLSTGKITSHDELPHGIRVLSYIDQSDCIGCGLCYVACRDGGHSAIHFSEKRIPTVDFQNCVGCGLCAQVCPVPECIDIEPERAVPI